MVPEFSRPMRLDTIGPGSRQVELTATPAECTALAARFTLIAVHSLSGTLNIVAKSDHIYVDGHMEAGVVQSCVATNQDVAAQIQTPFALKFVATGSAQAEVEELELSEDDCDIVEYEGQFIDLGEALAQTLLLALDPFPRSPNADAILKAAGVVSEEEAGPFGALAGLKKALENKEP